MTEMRVVVPADLEEWINSRIAEGRHGDAGEYLLDLIWRDRDAALAEAEETPEYIAWVREQVAEALQSPVLEQDPRDVIEEIIARRHAKDS